MNDARSESEAADRSHSEKPIAEERAESEIGNVAEKEVEYEGERIKTSVALLTSKSIKELEGLTFELKGLQEFLQSETERVQREIDNALSGVRIIMDTSLRGERRGRKVPSRKRLRGPNRGRSALLLRVANDNLSRHQTIWPQRSRQLKLLLDQRRHAGV